jgi:predicted AAA+ superfamily ATPase
MELDELLPFLNEWWATGKVNPKRSRVYHRPQFDDLVKLLDYQQITLITGLRRVGKTVLMMQLVEFLIGKFDNPKSVLYFSFDEKVSDLIPVLEAFQKKTGVKWKDEKVFVFFDEIQKLRDWSSKIKILYDTFPNVKLIVSGSGSLQLEADAAQNLAGRYFLKEVKLLSIKEFNEIKNNVKLSDYELCKRDLELDFDDFVRKPFPEIVSFADELMVLDYIKENVISKIIRVDLPDAFDRVNVQLLETLLEFFYKEPGMILNVDSLSKSLRVHKTILERHIHYLEFSKLIRTVKNFRMSSLSESRKLKKVYPYNISLVFAFNRFVDKGKVLESVVADRLNAERYWREGNKEIDFIIKNTEITPLEVKHAKELNSDDTKQLDFFIHRFKINQGIVVYRGDSKIMNNIKAVNIIDFIALDDFKHG